MLGRIFVLDFNEGMESMGYAISVTEINIPPPMWIKAGVLL